MHEPLVIIGFSNIILDLKMDRKRGLTTKDAYYSYLLRIWRLENVSGSFLPKQHLWRVSLECTRTRSYVMFNSLEDAFCFLLDQIKPKDKTPGETK